MKKTATILFLTMFTCLNVYSFSGEGSGTEEDPYQITNIYQLQEIDTDSAHLAAHYILMNDIDASVTREWNDSTGFVPVGDEETGFSGKLDGNNKTISGLYIFYLNYPAGIYEYISEKGIITDLNVTDFYIEGWEPGVGAIAGINSGVISNSFVSGEIYGSAKCGLLVGINRGGIISNSGSTGNIYAGSFCGGLVGYQNDGQIINSFSTAEVKGIDYIGGLIGGILSGNIDSSYTDNIITGTSIVGGLAGRLYGGNIRNCYSASEVNGEEYVGGLAGNQYSDTIKYSYATGKVTGDFYVGGLVGECWGTVSCSYSSCDVNGGSETGGLVGQNQAGIIQKCYSKSKISGSQNVGGLAGYNMFGKIVDSYSLATISGKNATGGLIGLNISTILRCYSAGIVSGDNYMGGGIGSNNEGTVGECFWDMETSGVDTSAGGTGLSTSQMKTQQTYTDSLWDFNTIWAISSEINDGYPYLQWEYNETAVNEKLSLNNPQIKIFPNPATDKINIILPKEAEINYIRISDISGREVKNVSINSYADKIRMDVSDLPQGFYIINLYSGAEVYSCAFVVE